MCCICFLEQGELFETDLTAFVVYVVWCSAYFNKRSREACVNKVNSSLAYIHKLAN